MGALSDYPQCGGGAVGVGVAVELAALLSRHGVYRSEIRRVVF
jgi:hypothetical protein